MGKSIPTNEDDFYAERSEAFAKAWEILSEGCEIPPSLDGFKHTLELARRRSRVPITAQQHARTIVDGYQRIQ